MAALATHCSQNERRADEAERDVDERYKCAWMEKHVGSEFDGIVSGVTSFGLFVELIESQVSGLVHITQLPNDYYHFDPVRHLLSGERRGAASSASATRCACRCCARAWRIARSISAWCRKRSDAGSTASPRRYRRASRAARHDRMERNAMSSGELLFGIHSVEAALTQRSEKHPRTVFRDRQPQRAREGIVRTRARSRPEAARARPRDALDRMTGGARHQGAVARYARRRRVPKANCMHLSKRRKRMRCCWCSTA